MTYCSSQLFQVVLIIWDWFIVSSRYVILNCLMTMGTYDARTSTTNFAVTYFQLECLLQLVYIIKQCWIFWTCFHKPTFTNVAKIIIDNERVKVNFHTQVTHTISMVVNTLFNPIVNSLIWNLSPCPLWPCPFDNTTMLTYHYVCRFVWTFDNAKYDWITLGDCKQSWPHQGLVMEQERVALIVIFVNRFAT